MLTGAWQGVAGQALWGLSGLFLAELTGGQSNKELLRVANLPRLWDGKAFRPLSLFFQSVMVARFAVNEVDLDRNQVEEQSKKVI